MNGFSISKKKSKKINDTQTTIFITKIMMNRSKKKICIGLKNVREDKVSTK